MTITRRWQAGAEIDTTNSHAIEFTSVVGALTTSNTQAKTGTYSFRLGSASANYGELTVTATTQLRVGWWWYANAVDPTVSNNPRAIILRSSGAELVRLTQDAATADLTLTAAALTDTAAGQAPQDAFHHFLLDVKVDSSAGWAVLYKDGIEIARVEGNTGNADIVTLRFGTDSSSHDIPTYWYYDDLYVDDTTGEAAATAGPAYRFGYVIPDGVGNYSEATPSGAVDHYTLVDDQPNDGDTSYVKAAAASVTESYAMTSYTLPSGYDAVSVIPVAICKKLSAADIKIAPLIRLSSTDWTGTAVAATTAYTNVLFQRRTTTPAGAAWTQANCDGMEVGFDSSGAFV